mgnify:CR=1 FL=1
MLIDIKSIVELAQKAGKATLEIYKQDFDFEIKGDNSPLTLADKKSNEVIIEGLLALYPEIPIISEENKLLDFSIRKNWTYCWLVDPLDGTKEFIKKNGEFTVNIALIHNGQPILGVVDVPVKNKTYYAQKGLGAFLVENGEERKIEIRSLASTNFLNIVGSRSHSTPELEAYVEKQKEKFETVNFVPAGSSLKFCLIAEGLADVYPRLGPTMEWETAAGQSVAMEAGAEVLIYETGEPLTYNREDLLNPNFIVKNPLL